MLLLFQAVGADPAMTAIGVTSVVSIGLLITVIGAAVYFGKHQGKTETHLQQIISKLDKLEMVPERIGVMEERTKGIENRLSLMEGHMLNLEGDVNNLWASYRTDA